METIEVGTASLTLCPMPCAPAPSHIDPWISDNVASVANPYNGVVQTQTWPGADTFGMTVTMPPLHRTGSAWIAWLMSMRGMERVVQLPWYQQRSPCGNPGASAPVVATSGSNNLSMSRVLYTRGWAPSRQNVLRPGDALQIGYRLYICTQAVSSDAFGNASFEIFPSLREIPADGTPLVLNNPQGLFRLAANKRSWSKDLTTTTLSFPLQEYR